MSFPQSSVEFVANSIELTGQSEPPLISRTPKNTGQSELLLMCEGRDTRKSDVPEEWPRSFLALAANAQRPVTRTSGVLEHALH